ncbi:MAG: transposase, partial [Acidobacteria bacterium]|nr:transposase [Acidobacteriota bacterium]
DYFHVVFTLPAEIGPLALRNPKPIYGLLSRCAAQTLLQVAASPQHLRARLGVLAVLHTWGQQLTHHPHVHCIVPGGGLSPAEDRWVAARPGYLLPVRVLSKVFRGKYLAGLKAAHAAGELALVGEVKPFSDPDRFRQLLDGLYCQEWVVYCKPPFAGPETVLKYLSRYTHRVALSNQRLVRLEGDTVALTYKDYRHGGQQRLLRLPAAELIRRFLQHVLPSGFVRIRYYGLLANRHRAEALRRCREALGVPPPEDEVQAQDSPSWTCPICGEGKLRIVEWIGGPRAAATLSRERAPPCCAA